MKSTFGLFILMAPLVALAQQETCDRFSFAVSNSKLSTIPVTVLRGGLSPVLEIAGQAYNYDVSTHCMSEAGEKSDCTKSIKVMSDKKIVALIEGQGRVTISPVDEKGKRDLAQPHYEVAVERDRTNRTRPLFVVKVIGADGSSMGRIDGVEGMTANSLQAFKGKLASAHRLIDLRGKNLVYANCRKLAVMHFQGENMDRAIASARKTEAPVKTPKLGGPAAPVGFAGYVAPAPEPAPFVPPPAPPMNDTSMASEAMGVFNEAKPEPRP